MQNYLGAKNGSGVYQRIVQLIPPHDTYIEPFLGTGAVLRHKAPAQRDIGVDLNPRCLSSLDHPSAELVRMCAFQFLRDFNFQNSGRVCLYLDPPYLPSTRTSYARYEHELTEDQHITLLELIQSLPANIILSGYPSDLYDSILVDGAGWWSDTFQAMSRGGVRTEKLWCNFIPGEIHYHTYAGKNFTDRQRIQRKADRWAAKIKKLPIGERQAVMAAMIQALSET